MSKLVRTHSPQLVFLSKTKKKSSGLGLLWLNDSALEIKFYSVNHIDAFIRDSSIEGFV